MAATLYDNLTHADQAQAWIRDNPAAFALFCQLALEHSRQGRRRIGAKFIAEFMRWRMEQKWEFQRKFKVNNNWTAELAREATRRHPVLKKAFMFRGDQKEIEVCVSSYRRL